MKIRNKLFLLEIAKNYGVLFYVNNRNYFRLWKGFTKIKHTLMMRGRTI